MSNRSPSSRVPKTTRGGSDRAIRRIRINIKPQTIATNEEAAINSKASVESPIARSGKSKRRRIIDKTIITSID